MSEGVDKNILVTGGGGFIGRNLISRLVGSGRYAVTCLDQREVVFDEHDVRCVQGNFSDRVLLHDLLPKTDVVVHLGSNALPANSDYVTDVEQNLLGSITLIKECELAGVKRIVFASSGGTIYGPDAVVPTPEDSPFKPICSYGIIKVAVENYLNLASRQSGLCAMTLRIANPYGPWQNWNSPQGAVAVFCHRIVNGLPITLYGDGSISRDFVYIDDVMDAFLKAIESTETCNSYNIGSGECRSMRDLVGAIERLAGEKAIVEVLPERGCDVPQSFLKIDKAAAGLSWRPTTFFEMGLRKTLDWQKANSAAF